MARRALTVLIIEDDPDDALIMQRALKWHFDVEFADSGADGVKRAVEGKFEAIVLDYRLGDLTGTEVMARIREGRPEVPVIVTSGMGSHFIVARTLALGARNFVSKDEPNFAQRLLAAVQEVTSEKAIIVEEKPKASKAGGKDPPSSRAGEFRRVIKSILDGSDLVATVGVVGSDGALIHGHVRDRTGAEDVTAVLAGTVQMMLSTVAGHLGYGKARSIVASYDKGAIAMAPLRGNLAIYFTSQCEPGQIDQLRAEIEAAAEELSSLLATKRFQK